MPVVLTKAPRQIEYTRNGVSIFFSTVSNIEAETHRHAFFKSLPAPESWGFDELLSIRMRPVRLAASKCVSMSGFALDDGSIFDGAVDEAQAVGYLCQLIDLEGFGDLYAFCEAIADGQKKTLLTT